MANYIMFVDESGDHNLSNIDDNFPLFCLSGCIFEKSYYHRTARQMVDDFKHRFWGSTDIVLHSRDIRRQKGCCWFLKDRDKREEFYKALNELIRQLSFSIIVVGILKHDHLANYGGQAKHPYHLALEFIMERFAMSIRRDNIGNVGHIIAESRGRVEDVLLKQEFFRLKNQGSDYQDFNAITTLWTEDKRKNIAGLQIADLIAYPVARKILNPASPQPSFDVLRTKIYHKPGQENRFLGYGLKIFPQAKFNHYIHLNGGS